MTGVVDVWLLSWPPYVWGMLATSCLAISWVMTPDAAAVAVERTSYLVATVSVLIEQTEAET